MKKKRKNNKTFGKKGKDKNARKKVEKEKQTFLKEIILLFVIKYL